MDIHAYSTKKSILLLVTVCAALLAVFAFTDLSISQALVNPSSAWGIFAEWSSEIPIDFLMMMSFAVLFLQCIRKKSFGRILGAILCFIGTFEYGFFLFFFSVKYANTKLAIILGATLGVVLGIGALFLAKKLTAVYAEKLFRAALIVVLSVLLQEVLINLLKVFWSRPRMRDLTAPYTDFTPWYLPRASALGGDSFPSAHTAKAAGACFYVLLCDMNNKLKGKRGLILGMGLLWTVIIAVGRIILAAHFASDVTVGAAVMLLSFLIVRSMVDARLFPQSSREAV